VNDQLTFNWSAERGSFPLGNVGREVIWQAPDQEGEVRIKVSIEDSMKQFTDEIKEDIKIINVHKLGIDLVKTDPNWFPEAYKLLYVPTRTYMCINDKWVHPGRKKMIRVKLHKVSREPGFCMNYPIKPNRNPDLFFDETSNDENFLPFRDKTESANCPTEIFNPGDNPEHTHHHLYMISKKKSNREEIIVRCEDFGSTGSLEVVANHCVPIPPLKTEEDTHKDCFESSNDIKIPRDDNDNDIVDNARQDMNGAQPGEDHDYEPVGDGYLGDGLTNYEEYRGFIVGGSSPTSTPRYNKQHIRTDPRTKDVFIYNEYGDDISYLRATGLKPHQFFEPEMFGGTDRRIINFNHGRHHGGEQKGIWLTRDNTLDYLGIAEGTGPGTPKTATRVAINYYKLIVDSPGSYQSTVAHELCHALNIWHHGRSEDHELSVDGFNVRLNHIGGVSSGDFDCIMCYSQFKHGWCHGEWPNHHGHLTAHIIEEDGLVVVGEWLTKPGTKLCTSNAPTGLNDWAPGHINPAKKGNCIGQLRVKDW
jgi:hypothetical protein